MVKIFEVVYDFNCIFFNRTDLGTQDSLRQQLVPEMQKQFSNNWMVKLGKYNTATLLIQDYLKIIVDFLLHFLYMRYDSHNPVFFSE